MVIWCLRRVIFYFIYLFFFRIEAIFNQFFIIIILIVTKNVYQSSIGMLFSHRKGKKYRNVTILDYDGNVINEPNGLILYFCNVIILIKDYNNVILQCNVASREPNAP